MEFHAYSSSPQKGKSGSMRALWRTQGLLHNSDSVVLPAVLLLFAVGMVMYQHITSKYDTSIRNFLFMILLSMFPLAFLEKKLLESADPLGILSKFSTKVVAMYACFLNLRLLSNLAIDGELNVFMSRNFAYLATACALLPSIFGFRMSRACIWEHRDVWCLAIVAILVGVSTELLDAYMKNYFNSPWARTYYLNRTFKMMFVTSSDYIEILSFVPAMWMVCRINKDATLNEVSFETTKNRAVALFAFLFAFYLSEDLYNAYTIGRDSLTAVAGHIAHFLLLLDFATFILAHLFDPDKYCKLMGKFWAQIADRTMV